MKAIGLTLLLGTVLLLAPSVVLAAEVEAELKVSKLSCGSCLYRIQNTVKEIEGIQGISRYDFPKGLVWIPYDPQKVTAQRIADTITDVGYPAEVIRDGLP